MRIRSASLLGVLLFNTAFANIELKDLVKVNPENKIKCVEYFIYQNTVYCSNKALTSQKIDPALYQEEQQKIVFDQRIWQPVWGKTEPNIVTIEYIPAGDNINHWHELITTHYLADLQKTTGIDDYLNNFITNLKSTGLNPEIIIHDKNSNEAIFEFKIKDPANLRQDELQKVTKTEKGIFVIHYVIKEADMGSKSRDLWLKNLKNSSIIP